VRTEQQHIALFAAVMEGRAEDVRQLCIADPGLVNACEDDYERSPLFVAVQFGHESVVRCLLSCKADACVPDAEGCTSAPRC
jgi:hypothetical protein